MGPNGRWAALVSIFIPAIILAFWPQDAASSEGQSILLSSSHDSYDPPMSSAYNDFPVSRVPPLPPSRPDISGFGYSYYRSSSTRRQKTSDPPRLSSREVQQEKKRNREGGKPDNGGRALSKETGRRWSTAVGVIAAYYLIFLPLKKAVGFGLRLASYFVVIHYILNHVLGVQFHPERAVKSLPSLNISPAKLLYALLARYFPLSAALGVRAHQAYTWATSAGAASPRETYARTSARTGTGNDRLPPPSQAGYVPPSMRHYPEDMDTWTWAERMIATRQSRQENNGDGDAAGITRDDDEHLSSESQSYFRR